ncbi:MAG: hypothetical protein QM655_03830 [Nocardioidaceae bacterium]
MGVSAVGNRGVQPGTIPWLFGGFLALLIVLVWMVGPPLTPGLRNAAHAECNARTGSDYRDYYLSWTLPSWSPPMNLDFTFPHWECTDLRPDTRGSTSLGWWTNPF